jgi:hypothetical protein
MLTLLHNYQLSPTNSYPRSNSSSEFRFAGKRSTPTGRTARYRSSNSPGVFSTIGPAFEARCSVSKLLNPGKAKREHENDSIRFSEGRAALAPGHSDTERRCLRTCRKFEQVTDTHPHPSAGNLRSEEWPMSTAEKTAAKRASRLATTPTSARGILIRAWNGTASPRGAIKSMCLECCGHDRAAISDCQSWACPLFEYRPFQEKK